LGSVFVGGDIFKREVVGYFGNNGYSSANFSVVADTDGEGYFGINIFDVAVIIAWVSITDLLFEIEGICDWESDINTRSEVKFFNLWDSVNDFNHW